MSSQAKPAIRTVPMTKARKSLGDLVSRIQRTKEYVILKKDGKPIAGMMDIDEFEDYLELNDPKVRRAIEKSSEEFRAGRTRPAGELLAELRRENKKAKVRNPKK